MREIDLGFQGYTPILSQTAQEYAINCCNDVVANFEKRTVDYFFVRLNDENDAWFLADSTVQARKSLAKYAFCKAAGLPVLEPQTPAATKRRVEQCTQWVNLGPMPVTKHPYRLIHICICHGYTQLCGDWRQGRHPYKSRSLKILPPKAISIER
jgi:hypothetical protein